MKFRTSKHQEPSADAQHTAVVSSDASGAAGLQSLFAKKSIIILCVLAFASVATALLVRSYAETTTLTKTWQTNTDWTTNSQLTNVTTANNTVGLAAVQSGSTPVRSGVDLARKHASVSSSIESSQYVSAKAFDGDPATRWASRQSSRAQWIYVDLGSKYDINQVTLNWEVAYAKAYKVQVSDNARNWKDIYSTQSGTGGVNDLTGLTGTGRYVRVYATIRGTEWGYSLWDFQVYGTPSGTTTTPTTYAPTGTIALTFDAGTAKPVDWSSATAQATKPTGTNVSLTYATSADNTTWSNPDADITKAVDSRYLRIVATLQTSDTTVTPTLTSLALTYNVTTEPPVTSFSLKSLDTTVSGTSVTATANVAANPAVTVSNYGVCARDAAGTNVDFGTNTSVSMSPNGTSFSATKTFEPGTYSYFACVNYDGVWTALGTKSFTIPSGTATSTTTMLPVGVTGNWALKFNDEFEGTTLNTNNWSTVDGWSMNNVTTRASNVSVSGGNLNLVLASATSGAEVMSDKNAGAGVGYGLPVGGYAEARMYVPGNGTTVYNWGGFWISGPDWPAAGEHDVAEGLGTQTVNYHSPSGSHNQGTVPGIWTNAFHTYGIHRKAKTADVYYDGKLVKSYSTDDNGKPQTIIFNIGADNEQVYGAASTIKVDYIRAWEPN